MKLTLSILFCLFTIVSVAQTPERHFGPERKDNIVIIETSDADSVAYEKILYLLAANEWFVENQERKNFLIKTAVRTIPALFSAETYLVIKRVANHPTTIHITGYLKATVGGSMITDEVNYTGAENGAYKKSFYQMQAIAKGYENGNVYYGRK